MASFDDRPNVRKLRDIYPNLETLLKTLRERPGMFLGEPTIRGLRLFLAGFEFAEDFHEVPRESRFCGGFDTDAFEKWIESRYNPRRLSLRSYGLAEHLAGSDASGLDLWFAGTMSSKTTQTVDFRLLSLPKVTHPQPTRM
jgi:hypothetical protein